MSNKQLQEAYPFIDIVAIGSGSGTGIVNSTLGQFSQPWQVDAIIVFNNDTVVHHVDLYLNNGATAFQYGSVTVPAGAGTAGAAPVDAFGVWALASFDAYAMPAGWQVQASVEEAVTAGKLVDVYHFGAFLM